MSGKKHTFSVAQTPWEESTSLPRPCDAVSAENPHPAARGLSSSRGEALLLGRQGFGPDLIISSVPVARVVLTCFPSHASEPTLLPSEQAGLKASGQDSLQRVCSPFERAHAVITGHGLGSRGRGV